MLSGWGRGGNLFKRVLGVNSCRRTAGQAFTPPPRNKIKLIIIIKKKTAGLFDSASVVVALSVVVVVVVGGRKGAQEAAAGGQEVQGRWVVLGGVRRGGGRWHATLKCHQ